MVPLQSPAMSALGAGCGLCGHAAPASRQRIDELLIGRCPGCGAGRVLAAPVEEGYEEDYSARYTSELDRGKAESCWRLLERSVGSPAPGASLLELGCGDGGFLDLCRERGLATAGLEVSRQAAAAAAGRGHRILVGSAEEPLPGEEPFGLRQFDLVVAWDLLEHLHAPRRALELAHRALRPGGRLVLATPRMGSVFDRLGLPLARVGVRQLARMCFSRDHLFRFHRPGLLRVLGEIGFATATAEPVQLTSLAPERYAGGRILPSWTGVAALDRGLSRLGFAAVKLFGLSNKLLVVAARCPA